MSKKRTKPTLLFIHGFRGAPNGVDEITKQLSDYKIFVPYIPPSGDQSLKKYTVTTYVEFLKSYIKKHKIKKPVLIGHSMGTIIAAAFAEKYPDLINKKIILLAPITKRVAKPIALLSPLIAILPTDWVSRITNDFLFVPRNNKELYKHTIELTRKGARTTTSKHDVAKSAFFSVSHTVNEFDISQQVLVITGSKDHIMPRGSTRAFAARKKAKLVFIPNAGHLLNYEAPVKTAKIIRDFLEQ